MNDFTDTLINQLVKNEENRQFSVINLIASENYTFKNILKINGSVLTNKYAEGYPYKRYYNGCSVIDEIEEIAIKRAKQLFGADHANVQPLSGSQANAAAYFALLKPHDTILSLALTHGGHLTHGLAINFSGTFYNFKFYHLDPITETINFDEIDKLCQKHKPKLILCGYSAYSRFIDFAKFKEIANKYGAYLMADIAHIAGLVVAGMHPSPVPYADIVTSTTQKSLGGPRGGIILCKAKHAVAVDKAVFPGIQGGPHMNTIASKAVCFLNAMSSDFIAYQKQVLKNSACFANEMIKRGYLVISKKTDNHLFTINVKVARGLTGKVAVNLLAKIDIICNKNLIIDDEESPFVTSGLRFGTYAPTALGFIEKDFVLIADIIDQVLSNPQDNKLYLDLKNKVAIILKQYAHNFSKFKY